MKGFIFTSLMLFGTFSQCYGQYYGSPTGNRYVLRNCGSQIRSKFYVKIQVPSGKQYRIPVINGMLPSVIIVGYYGGDTLYLDYSKGGKYSKTYDDKVIQYQKVQKTTKKVPAVVEKAPVPKAPFLSSVETKMPELPELPDEVPKPEIPVPALRPLSETDDLFRPSQVQEDRSKPRYFPRYREK
jgi:hypothetical protein